MKEGVHINELQLCLDFADHISEENKLLYLDSIKEFIDAYNARQVMINLLACTKENQKSLIVTIQDSRLIEPEKQALYVAISTVGIAYPLSGGGFGFAWLGMNGTNLQLQFSKDLDENKKPVYRYFSSWPYFKGLEALKVKHMAEFQEFMTETMVEIEALLQQNS